MTRAICHFDNAYWLPHVSMHGWCARTNTQSNTAFRGFGGPQGAIAIEFIIDSIARGSARTRSTCGAPTTTASAECNVTPYQQKVEDNVLEPLTEQLAKTSGYRERRAEIAAFNAKSPVLKRGIAFTPVKFGISFNVNHFNQAGALVHVYTDGSVLVNHGGTEMGQGVNTKVAQVVAHELGIPLASVRCTATDTQQGGQHLGHRRLHRRRPERQGGAGRGAQDPRAARCACRRARPDRGALRRTRPGRLRGTRAVVERRLLRHARPVMEPRDDDRQTVLLFRLRRCGQRGHRRHADRRAQAARAPICCTTSAARSIPPSTSARSRAPTSRAMAG